MEYKFLKQPHSGEDAKLCGFFSIYHFTNGEINRESYINTAINFYSNPPLSAPPELAKELVMDGNDPAVFTAFNLIQGKFDNAKNFEALIVCDVNRGHFFTIRKIDGKWYNFDSFNYESANLIGNNEDAKKICGDFDVYHEIQLN